MNKPSQTSKKEISESRKKEIKDIKAKEKKLVKKIIILILGIFVVTAAVLLVLNIPKNSGEEYEHVSVQQIQETYPTLNPYDADFDKDLSSHNPDIMYVYTDGNAYAVKDIPEDTQNEAHRFFTKYFDLLKNGDYESYSSLFTKSYKKDPKGFEKDFERQFPPQELFDIRVKELMRSTDTRQSYTYEGKECFFGYYLVSFKINRNDGMFRRDLYSGEVERPLVFELVTFNKDKANEETYIKNLYTETSIQAQ